MICGTCKEEKEGSLFTNSKSRCRPCDNARKRKERMTQKDKYLLRDRKKWLKRNYNISLEQYIELFNAQQGRCKICSVHQAELPYNLAVDHCHKTGKVRGLLCKPCNSGIGLLKDDPILLEKAREYLSA